MKNTTRAYAILAIAFVLFNVIVFVVPAIKLASFWISYVFTVVAFCLQIAIWNISFKGADTLKSKFLGVPLISVGLVYLIIQILVFALFMLLPITTSWIAVVACALILGISAICLIGTEVGKEEINSIEDKVEKKIFHIKLLQADVEMLAETEMDSDTKVALIKLAEKIRFSDPISNGLICDIETQIMDKIEEAKKSTDKKMLVEEIEVLLTERNKKTKLLKGG